VFKLAVRGYWQKRNKEKGGSYFHGLVEGVDLACVAVAGALPATEQI
jgi:hypothetical protein